MNFSIFSDPPSPNDNENISGRNSVASNLCIDRNDYVSSSILSSEACAEDSPLPVSMSPQDVSLESGLDENSIGDLLMAIPDFQEDLSSISAQNDDLKTKTAAGPNEQKPLSGKLLWLWRFQRNNADGTSEKGTLGSTKTSGGRSDQNNSVANGSHSSSARNKGDAIGQNVMVSLRNLGHSMLENIQVIESAFQLDCRGQESSLENFSGNILAGKGQVTAMAALKELRKISNLLSKM